MKQYKYVRLGIGGDSQEFDGKLLFTIRRPVPNDLNRLLSEGWQPVRETVVTWNYWWFIWRYSYPYILVLLEKETIPLAEPDVRITTS